jgi:prepilin-type N-terminal cleavage/methylation domain-containing protein
MGRNKYGFTFIELLVVIAIILMISGISLAYYNTFADDKKLDSETRRLIDVLELAKKKAAAGDDSCDALIPPQNLTGYQVVISSNGYTLQQCCGTSGACSATTTLSTYTIDTTQVTIQNTGTYRFKLLSSGVTPIGIGNTVKVKHSVGKCMDISVINTGLIDVGAIYTSGC